MQEQGWGCSIAIRIARAETQKEKVLFCGYHGWHDWYLSQIYSNSLDTQLLSGLKAKGIPRGLKNTAIPLNIII